MDINNISLSNPSDWHYIQLPNAHCVSYILSFKSYKLLALINIKNNYPYENDELQNTFAQGFDMDKQVQIINGKSSDTQAVFCSHGKYLFSLSELKKPIYNETLSIIGLIAFSLAFLHPRNFSPLFAPFFASRTTMGLPHFGQ